jgi:uncharacterized membrane protein YhhN
MENNMKLKKFIYVFIAILCIDLIGILCAPLLRLIFKPLIMTSLIVYYVYYMQEDQRKIILSALLLGLVGDVLLLFDQNTKFFIGGLIAFLIMHLSYARFFKKYYEPPVGRQKIITIGLGVFTILFNVVFFAKLGDMKWLIMVYSIVIFIMAYFGVNQKLSPQIRIGALFFVLSDFILATNKFLFSTTLMPYLVMITYAAAQYLIVMGLCEEGDILKELRKKYAKK